MNYIFTFLEGIASFVSPCMLPMLPIYLSYLAGSTGSKKSKTVINSIGFVIGFTITFLTLAILASMFGNLISYNIKYFKVLFGVLIIILGLNYMEILNIKFLNNTKMIKSDTKKMGFVKAMIFGILFSFSWTPCIGTFLSSALLLIAKQQDILQGVILMLVYSMGMGIPFIISAVLIEKSKELFNFVKKHYDTIKKVSGVILIIMGIYVII